MPIPAAERQRLLLFAVAVMAVVGAAAAFRLIDGAGEVAGKPVPTTDLRRMSSYLRPLSETSSLAPVAHGTMVGDRDPFASTASAAIPRVRANNTTSSLPKTDEGQRWVVSSILFEDSKRSAIVNNAWVTVGDPLGLGASLTAIERTHVIVTDAKGNRHVVSIQGGEQ